MDSVKGAFRESNSGPLAPKARIIPLDQTPLVGGFNIHFLTNLKRKTTNQDSFMVMLILQKWK